VDDDPLQLRVLSSYLGNSGFPDITTAESAESALKIISESFEPFDVFLLDIRMPGMDGISLCRNICSLPGYSDATVIMISSLKDKSQIQEAFHAGAVDYVIKPFDVLELKTRIRMSATVLRYRDEAAKTQERFNTFYAEVIGPERQADPGPTPIFGIASFVDYVVLCNLMLQTPLTRTFSVNAFAVRINAFDNLVESWNLAEQYQLLQEVAKVLSDSLAAQSYFISYIGNGIFVCASHKYDHMEMIDFTDTLRLNIEGLTVEDSTGFHQDISLTVGPRTFNKFYNLDRRVGLLLRSIDGLRLTASTGTSVTERMRESVRQALQESWVGRLLRVFDA
jgi:CheY-like chemotaxis protein